MANWWTYKDKKKAKANNGTSRQPERHQADAKPSVNNENWWKYRSDNSTFYQMQASDRDQLEQQAQMRQYLETVLPYYERYHAARNAVLENRKWDAFSDKIERAIPFMSGDSLAAQERAANIAASRYDRDFPLYQQMMENAVSGRPYNKAYDMAANAHSTAFQKYNAYNNARLQNLHDTDRGAYYAETMDRSEIEAELARLKAGGSTTHISASGAMYGGAGGKIDEPVTQIGDRIAQYERALSILQDQDNTKKYEEIKAAWWSPDNQPELDLTESGAEDLYYSPLKREATELAELGRAAYEKDLANGAHYASSGALHGGYGGKLYSGDEEERNRQLGIDAEAAIEAQVKESALFGPDATHTPAKTYSERGPEEGYLQQWQKDIFYAMYATDPEEAKRWLTLAHEQAENEYLQGVSDETGRNFVTQILGIPLAAGAGLLSGLDPFGETGQALSKFSEAVTHGGAKAWNEASGTANIPLLGEKGLGDLYSLGVSMVQSGALAVGSAAAGRYDATLATVVEFLGTTLLGSSAAASDYRQSLNRGLNREQAMRHATAAGIAEAAFEYISLDKLVNQDVSRGFWKNVFMQGGIEASEELCTTLANRASDALLAYAEGYDTSIQQRVKELVALGLSRRDAEYKAEQEWFAELISDGLGGFVSGGLMTAGNTVVNWNEYQSGREQQRTAGEYARNARQTDALRRYAEDNGLGWYAKEQATRTETAQVKDTTSTTSQGEAPYSQGKGSGGQVARATQENDGTGNLSPTTKQTKKSRGEKRQERQQAREQRKQDWQIGSDVQRVQAHIQEQFSGKSVQEQTALRDQMIEQYGNGIAPAVYEAISVEAAKKAASLKSADEIRAARDQAVSETKDRAMKRAIADGYDQAVFGQAMRSGNTDEAGRYFQQLRNTGEGGMTLEATVEGEDGQSKQVAITGMTEDGRGVKLADGSTVAVSKLQADADTMDAVQRIAELEMGADADAVLQAYIKADKSGVDGYRWLMDYSLAYEQGRTGKLSLEEAVQRSNLDQRTVMDAYTLGQREAHQSTRDAVESLKAMPKKQGITGKTSNIDTSEIEGVTLNESEREQFELANKLFSLIGVDVKWVASAVKNGRFVGANGSYLNGAVTLDVHAGRNFLEQINSGILATTGHELTHFLQQYAPEQYRALKEFLFRQIVQSSANGETRLERLIWEKQRRASSKLSRKAAEDEVVADACQTMLRDSKAIREFAQQDEEAAKGVARWLDKWFGKLKQAFSRSAQLTEEARFVDSFAKEVREAFGKLWDEALREAVETHERVGNIEKPQQQNSDRDTEYLELAKDPEKNAVRLQEMVDEAARKAGYTIKAYHGTPKKFNVFSKDRIGSTTDYGWFGKGFYFTDKHDVASVYAGYLNDSNVIEAYLNVQNPFDFNEYPGAEDKTAGQIMEEVMGKKYGRRGELTEDDKAQRSEDFTNWLRENGYDGVRAWSQIMILDSEQAKRTDPVTYDDSGNVIPLSERFNRENEDIRYSERDSAGRELSEGQKEYFKDSRARDFSGRLLVLYHQTDNDFTIFDPRHEGAGTRDQQTPFGIFLKSSDRDIGVKGKKQMALYANITKPLVALNRENLESKLRDLSPKYAKLSDQHKALDQEYKQKHEQAKQAFTDYLTVWREQHANAGRNEIYQDAEFDRLWNAEDEIVEEWEQKARELETETKEVLTNALEAAGYDGIFLGSDTGSWGRSTDAYIALHPEQVKNVDNLTPTENPDIRYSERDYSLPSDLELMDRAIEGLSEAGGEEYWKALLETDSGLAEDVKGYKDQARKLAAAEKRLADYKKQMQLGGNRKLNTRGITSLSLEMMKTLDASDAKGRGVAKQVTQTLTSAYQKALDAIDKGTSDADAWDIVYNEGVVPAAEIIAKQGTHSEKTGRGWITTSLESYYGEGGMQAIIDTVAGYVGADFATNRYRKAIQPTIADRIVERTEKRMQKQVDAATERATEAERINKKLTEDRDFWKNQQAKDSETVTFLNERLKEARQDLRDNKSLSAQERRKLAARIKSLQTQLQAKREEIRALKSLSQQLDKQAVEFGQKQAKLLDKLEQQVQRERDILSGKLKPLGMQRLLKAEREKAVAKAEQHKDEVFRNYKDRQQQAKLRGRIKNLSDEMKRRMTNPSERAYVPASLYESMTRLADVLDDVLSPNPGSKAEAKYRSMMDAIHELAREYAAVKDLDDPVYSSEYDQEIQEAISDIERVLERKDADWIAELTGDTKKGLRELSTGELQRIYELMRQINYAMVGATSMLGFTGFKNVFDAMQSVVGQMQNEKSLKSLSKHEKAKRLRMLDNLSVMRAVEMMSGWDRSAALYQLFHAIEQGTDESWAWVMGYNKSLQDLKTGKNEKAYRKALTEALDFGITDEEGLKVTMTKMQAIQILMTAEREAHNDKLLHLQTGGAVIRNAEDIQNGKGAKATSQTVKVTPELLQKIQDSLTDWDRAYMKAVRSYFQKEGRRTNEIMYKLKHRVLQTEEYYVPYSVDKNYLETNLDERQAMSMWVKTPGSTNALQQKAKQPVIIDGMDAVMERHVKEIADYIGLALPIRDFSKVYNGMLKTGGDNPLPVKETIDRAFGSKGQHLLTQAVIDVQGGSAKQNWSSGISDFLSGLQSAFVRSALLINPSVTIKQAASYIAAESILSHRALVAGNRATFSSDKTKSPALIAYLFANPEGKTAHRIYNEIDRYTSLHYQRRLGMSQAEIANEANRTGKLKRKMNMIGANMEQSKIGHAVRKTGENLNPVTWIQRMDVATTATLWVACKEQAKLDGMKAGTAEFWQRTTELYERCLRETQPMYDGLHRTAHQKQAGGLVQFLFPFRTVPIQNHGQLAASYETLKASKNKSKAEQAEAKRFFAKTVWAQTESAFIFAMMTFIAAALKRKTKKYRDEDEEFTAESFAKGLMTDVGSTLFSVLVPMYGSELVNIGSRALDKFQGNSGYTYDAFSVGVVDMLNDLASSFDKIAADFGKIARGEDVSFGDVGSHGLAMLLKAAKLAGIPADTVRTYFNGFVGNAEDIANGRIPALNDESWERATGVNAKRFYEAWEAGDEAKMQTVLNEVRQSGKSEDSIANAFNSYAKDAYENNGLSLEQYADYLDKTGMFDAEKISGKVKNLVRDEFQAGERSEDEAISALTGICGMDEDAAWKTVQRWEAKAEHADEEDYSYSQYEDLREALDEGKSLKEAGADYLAHGYTEKQITDAAVDHLKDRYLAGEISEDEAVKTWAEYKGKDENEAWMAVQRWESAAAHADEEDYSFSQYDAIDEAIAANKDIKALVKELTDHGVEEKNITSHVKSYLVDRYVAGGVTETALKNQLSRYLGIVAKDDVDKILNDANSKKQYGVNYSSLDEEYRAGNIKASEMKNALMKYGGLSAADAEKKIRWYDLQKANPSLEISESKANAWYDGTSYTKTNGHESAKTAGMSIQDYLRAKDELAKVKGVDANNDGRTDTGSREIAYIRTLTAMSWLTDRQRRALYYEEYKGTSKTSGRPW